MHAGTILRKEQMYLAHSKRFAWIMEKPENDF